MNEEQRQVLAIIIQGLPGEYFTINVSSITTYKIHRYIDKKTNEVKSKRYENITSSFYIKCYLAMSNFAEDFNDYIIYIIYTMNHKNLKVFRIVRGEKHGRK